MFEEVIDFFLEYNIFELVKFVVLLIVGLISFKRTGSVSKNIKGELDEMKHRLPNYRENEQSPSQSFKSVVDTYRLNKSTNELEIDDKLDLQERTNSSRCLALCEILDTLEPQVTALDEIIDINNELQDDLDVMTSFEDWKNDACGRYDIDPRLSMDKISKILNDKKASAEEEYSNLKQSISSNIKEVKDNALWPISEEQSKISN